MKKKGEKISWLTAYDFPTAQFAEAAGIEMLLVGDSLGMCVYGYKGTVPVTMDQCIFHCDAVLRGAPGSFTVGDMPFMSYQSSGDKAVENAGRFLKEAEVVTNAMSEYRKDVKSGTFPQDDHCYHIIKGQEEEVEKVFQEFS